MATRIDQERVKILLEKSGLNDRQISEHLGTNQSTVWRLRHGKISKIDKYIEPLECLIPGYVAQGNLAELSDLAEQSPAFRAVLESLMRFMHECSPTAVK
ncbi:helix-turn-helix domain-containing protein [Brevundimonas sp.]|uniref:helix-turn-helix domain-containing protein n=1 Tax=Brevundimonas sp. TaxID=1871086 RepID=UPI002D67CD24|nr:helix-turn-helix domain-containing protein [Brevundimonas sp.]HYC97029.1 helix-turn-helix domain-containing protein [Brevundimonas sp.]